jgi:hypothetical protein
LLHALPAEGKIGRKTQHQWFVGGSEGSVETTGTARLMAHPGPARSSR